MNLNQFMTDDFKRMFKNEQSVHFLCPLIRYNEALLYIEILYDQYHRLSSSRQKLIDIVQVYSARSGSIYQHLMDLENRCSSSIESARFSIEEFIRSIIILCKCRKCGFSWRNNDDIDIEGKYSELNFAMSELLKVLSSILIFGSNLHEFSDLSARFIVKKRYLDQQFRFSKTWTENSMNLEVRFEGTSGDLHISISNSDCNVFFYVSDLLLAHYDGSKIKAQNFALDQTESIDPDCPLE